MKLKCCNCGYEQISNKQEEIECPRCHNTRINFIKEEIKLFDLGIMPQGMWIQSRIEDIKSAMDRYFKSNREIPNNWIIEYNRLIAWRDELNGETTS